MTKFGQSLGGEKKMNIRTTFKSPEFFEPTPLHEAPVRPPRNEMNCLFLYNAFEEVTPMSLR